MKVVMPLVEIHNIMIQYKTQVRTELSLLKSFRNFLENSH